MTTRTISILLAIVLLALSPAQASQPGWLGDATSALEQELIGRYGEGQRVRVQRGVAQVASFWHADDGDREAFESFVRQNFAGDAAALDVMFVRFETLLEKLDGHMLEILLVFRKQSDLDIGPILPYDSTFAAYNPAAHVNDDFFRNKLAFAVLLNFPISGLDERLADGDKWSRRQWAEARLADRFSTRIPAEVQQAVSQSDAASDEYIAEYNIWMHHLLTDSGERLFLSLIHI